MARAVSRTWRIAALALFAGVFLTAQPLLMNEVTGHHLTLRGVAGELLFWVVWAGYTPLVLKAADRWPLGIGLSRRALLVHLACSIVLAPLADLTYLALEPAWRVATGQLPAAQFMTRFIGSPAAEIWGFFMGMLYYWALLVLLTAFRFRGLYETSRLDALRAQLRPHFLFNTLNAISVLARRDPDKTQLMVQRLASLLRRSLDEQAHEVPLRQELAFLEDYLDIQRVRFGDRLQVHIDVDPAVLDVRVPVFLLQPLVENSLVHGVSDDGGTAVSLTARQEGGTLRLVLEDDGAGVDSGGVREGIGISNTRARLEQLYGARAAVTLATREPDGARGTRVAIVIPL